MRQPANATPPAAAPAPGISAATAQTLLLWPQTASLPNAADKPVLIPYLHPDGGERPLVIVCPGGGYGGLADHEGAPIAKMLNTGSFHAAVLRYRVAPHHHPDMINDAQRAVRLVRQHAADWGVAQGRVAVLGFSAGGHLVSTLATHFDEFTSPDDDLAGTISARPDAVVLCYAVTDFGPRGHSGSRDNLLGPNPDPALVEKLNNHKQVTKNTPPTFLWHTADDPVVPLENSLWFAQACKEHGVPVELHVYESGPHGLGLGPKASPVATWPQHCVAFLHRHLDVKGW